jgi:hypothetical protein
MLLAYADVQSGEPRGLGPTSTRKICSCWIKAASTLKCLTTSLTSSSLSKREVGSSVRVHSSAREKIHPEVITTCVRSWKWASIHRNEDNGCDGLDASSAPIA